MAIYPDRKAGALTGRYRIEVQLAGRRLRGRAGSLPEAKAMEADLTHRLAHQLPDVAPVKATQTFRALTLGDGVKSAQGILWSGQSTEANSLRKLARIRDILGESLPLADFDANAVDKVVTALKDGEASDATVNRYLSAISTFMTFCKRRGLKTNDLPEMEWRDEDEGRIRWITYEEETVLLRKLPAPYDTLAYVAIRTGMRVSELLSIKPSQLEAKWVHLWGDGTKNGSSRSVPLSADLHARLEPLVTGGLMPTYPQVRHQWDAARAAMGLSSDPTFVFHACRHTFATRAVQAGVNIRVIQKLMGHKTIQTTLRYAHVDDKTLADAALAALTFHDARGAQGGGRRVGEGDDISLFVPAPTGRTEPLTH